jgi:hypothetical protein
MTLPVSCCPVTAAPVAVGFGTLIPTGGFGEPCRWPGEVVADGPDVEGLALAVALDGLGVGLGVGVGVGRAGTGEMAERVAACGVEDDAAAAEDATADAASDAWAAADNAAAELAAAEPAAAAELTAAELPGA